MNKLVRLLLVLFFFPLLSYAQKPQGRFLGDSLYIGKPIEFVLTCRHAAEIDIFFPDTTYKFSPFEVLGRSYFPTVTNETGSLDSVVYTLVSFDVSAVQKLNLPVFVYTKPDCTVLFSQADSIFLHQAIIDSPNKYGLLASNSLLKIKKQTDFLKIIVILGGIFIVMLLIYLAFGNRIKKQINLFKLRQEHLRFLGEYRKNLKKDIGSKQIGEILVLWKKYVGNIKNVPYLSFTTKEIIDHLPDEDLENALKELDTAIYGELISVKTPAAMRFLQTKAIEFYQEKRNDIENEV